MRPLRFLAMALTAGLASTSAFAQGGDGRAAELQARESVLLDRMTEVRPLVEAETGRQAGGRLARLGRQIAQWYNWNNWPNWFNHWNNNWKNY